MKFWIPWSIAAAVTGIAVVYFFMGLATGSVSSFNMGLWVLILLGTIGVTAGSWVLKKNGRTGMATLLTLVLALPGLIAGLLLLLLIVAQPSWN